MLKWAFERTRDTFPTRALARAPERPPERVDDGSVRITFVGHASLLVQMDGYNVLTDPVWSERVGPSNAVGPARRTPPGIDFEALPRIDAVVLSHNHYDHFDLPTLQRLESTHHPDFVTGLGNAIWLERIGAQKIHAIDWWEKISTARGLDIVGVPAQHFSGRGLCDQNGTLWLGFVIRSRHGDVYFAGDTGYAPHFRAIGRRYRRIRVALLPIGSYRPRWFMRSVHIDPWEAVKAQRELGARHAIPMHFATFQQGDDGDTAPIADLATALDAERRRTGHFPSFLPLRPGESTSFGQLEEAAIRQAGGDR